MLKALKIFFSTFKLTCPRCRDHKLYKSFGKVHPRCPNCDLLLDWEGDVGGPQSETSPACCAPRNFTA